MTFILTELFEKLTFTAFRLKKRRKKTNKFLIPTNFSEFHCTTLVLRQLDKQTNLRLEKINENVLSNIKHDYWNLRITINFTTSFHLDKKEIEITTDISTIRLLACNIGRKTNLLTKLRTPNTRLCSLAG